MVQSTFLHCEAKTQIQVVVPKNVVSKLIQTVPDIADMIASACAARRQLLMRRVKTAS